MNVPTTLRRALPLLLLSILGPVGLARAHHVVWLDFSSFDLSKFNSVNGNSPPTLNDKNAIMALVLANMRRDYAPFDAQITIAKPANGRYSRVRFLGTSQLASGGGGLLYGCAGSDCCPSGGTCTGIGSWNGYLASACEVYGGSVAVDSSAAWSGANATTARIANALSHTGSHELGHLLGLTHCYAADDRLTAFSTGNASTSSECGSSGDANVNWHIMSSGTSWGLSSSTRATRDRFFSVHASRRALYSAMQARNHWKPLPNVNAGIGAGDLTYNRSSSTIGPFVRLSSGSTFESSSSWGNVGADADRIELLGDVDGDGRADLVHGFPVASNQVTWLVYLSTGLNFSFPNSANLVWSGDAGDAGDIFRLADVTGDGRDDLIYGRPIAPFQVTWYVRPSTGNSFGPYSTWASDAGDEGDIFLLGDVDADGREDLVYGRTTSATQVTWYARLSTGSSFDDYSTWSSDAGDPGDLFYLGDVSGDGRADLVYGEQTSDTNVDWYVRLSVGAFFGPGAVWVGGGGDAGDLFRLGDGDGDGRLDLFYGRPEGMNDLTGTPDLTFIRWFGRRSSGSSFGTVKTWVGDAGDEGDVFP